jgi:hypothetical protein
MSHKRKGQLTTSGEWAKHLRPLLRRVFWKKERQAATVSMRGEAMVGDSGSPSPEFKRPERPPDLKVELSLLPTNDGGRTYGLWQGCRLPHDFGLPDEMNDGAYEFLHAPPLPGKTAEAYVWLLAPERNKGRLYEGFEFRVWEGRFVGIGKIVEVTNPALRRS